MVILPAHPCPFQFVAGWFSYRHKLLINLFQKLNFSYMFICELLMVQQMKTATPG